MTLQEFPLAWRWTDTRYASFPPEVLALIHPLTPEAAKEVLGDSISFWASDKASDGFRAESQISTGNDSSNRVSKWLFEQLDAEEDSVYVSWQPALAVETTWNLFVRYWDDFCYPSSDDVRIWTAKEDWLLIYHHSEFMRFAKRRSD